MYVFHDPEFNPGQQITGFFKEFFEVMGQHMMELGDKEEAAKQEAGAAAGSPVSPEDQAHLDKIMQDPEGVTVKFRLSAWPRKQYGTARSGSQTLPGFSALML